MTSTNVLTDNFVGCPTNQQDNYKTKPGYVQAPYMHLYHTKDVEIPNEPYVEDILDDCWQVAESIEGDLNCQDVADRIKFNDFSFVVSGCLLFKIKYFKLYKDTHTNYKDWCKEVLGKSYHTVERMIKSAYIVITLIHFGFSELPSSISQCMVLHNLSEDEEELYRNWKLVTENLEPHQVTADSIKVLLEGKEDKPNTTVKLPIKLYEKMSRTAFDIGCTIIDLVKQCYYEVYEKVESLTPSYDFDPMEGLQENYGVP